MLLARIVLTVTAMFLFTSAAWAKIDTVRLTDFAFVPASLSINRGDTVVFKSTQQCCIAHTSTRSGLYSWDSGPIPLNGTFLVEFRDAGKFDYACTPHGGIGMLGTVNVVSKASSTGWMGLTLLLASLAAAGLWFLESRRKPA